MCKLDPERFDYLVAFSYEGSLAKKVQEVVDHLGETFDFVHVFFDADRHRNRNLTGENLVHHLDNVYTSASLLVVVFHNDRYAKEKCTKFEWNLISGKFLKGSFQDRLLVYSTEPGSKIPGLHEGFGVGPLESLNDQEIAKEIVKKLCALTGMDAETLAGLSSGVPPVIRRHLPKVEFLFGRAAVDLEGDEKKKKKKKTKGKGNS